MARDAVLKAHASSVSVCSNDLLAPRESARGAVSLLSVKNKSGERTRRDAQLRVTVARSAAVTIRVRRRAPTLKRSTAIHARLDPLVMNFYDSTFPQWVQKDAP